MNVRDWIAYSGSYAAAARRIYDADGSSAKRGDVGEICDVDTIDGYVVVDFPATGPILCLPEEIRTSRKETTR